MNKKKETSTVKDLIKKSGITPEKKRDQHFLIDDSILDRIVNKYSPEGKRALEIGGGIGNLTTFLLDKFDEVTVIEKDKRLADFLESEFPDAHIISKDALEIDFPNFDVCVSNPPYSISTPLLFRLVPLKKDILLTLQKEVAERVAASPDDKSYGRLSVAVQYYSNVEVLEELEPEVFDPPPEVKSSIIRFYPRDPDYTVDDKDFFFRFIKGIFTQRRKKLKNAIENSSHITGIENSDKVPENFCNKRPDELSPKELSNIVKILR